MGTCRQCGKEVTKGTLCDECKMRLALDLKAKFKKETVSLEEMKSSNGFYRAHYKGD